jgi:transcription elongation factor Elf1
MNDPITLKFECSVCGNKGTKIIDIDKDNTIPVPDLYCGTCLRAKRIVMLAITSVGECQ